jgi:cytochrome c oxidase subunit 2
MPLDFPLFPEAASTMAGQVDAIYIFLVILSAFMSILIAGAVIYCAVRYRRKADDEIGTTLHGSILLEIVWSAIPLAICLVLFFWGAKVFFAQSRPPANALEFTAIGKQWMWKFQHPDGQREINTLHVPIGQPIKITAISQDVIHSLYFPAFRVKKDVLPGRYTTVWFEATKTGSYHIFCAEFCGAEHSKMGGQVVVLEPEEYERWLAGGAAASLPPAEAGRVLFDQLACTTCHGDGDGGRGPALRGLYGEEVTLNDGRTIVANDEYLRESILNPANKIVAGFQPLMPTYKGQISEENVFKLITYIKSLSPGREASAGGPVDEVTAPEDAGTEDTL